MGEHKLSYLLTYSGLCSTGLLLFVYCYARSSSL